MLMHNSTLLRTIERVRGYQPGINNAEATIKGVVIVNRFCDEVMSPELFRTQVADGAQILVNMSSLSWFHGSVSMYDQMLRIAKVRAVENGRFLVQSGNMAPAFILNQYGDVVRESVWGHRQVVLYDVPARTNMTPYVLFGHWFIVLCCLMIALRFLFQTNKIKKIV